MSDLGPEIPAIYEAGIRGSYAAGRLAGLREAAEAGDVEALISIWIKRPRSGTAEGRAWEEGARQAFGWKSAAILALASCNDAPQARP